MKQFGLFLLLTILMSMMGGKAFAHDIEAKNADGVTIYYNWINNKTELAVSGKYPEYMGNIVIPESVEYNGSTYSVTSIGEAAFMCCFSLNSITIPNSVTSIGSCAFYYCNSLTAVTIPNSVTSIGQSAFSGCSGLTSVIIPNSVTSIGNRAFEGCSDLTSVTVPQSVISIAERSFFGCSGLTSVTIPNSVTSIGNSAFASCSGLTSVIIPNNVTSIGGGAFSGCSGLTSVIIPNSVTTIGQGAFQDCSGLTSMNVEEGNPIYDSRDNCNAIIKSADNELIFGCQCTVIPNSVTSIGGDAFAGCSTLTSVTIPNNVTSIGQGAFQGCSGLTSMKVEEGNPIYDSRDNCNAIIKTTFNEIISGCQSTDIPYSVTSIGKCAFMNCSSLTSVAIPNSVRAIGDWAFEGCSSLTSVTIPNSVTYIGICAFEECSGLNSVIIPNNVKSIGEYAFYECTSLTSVTIKRKTPIKITYYTRYFTFTNCKNATLYVPKGSKTAYETDDFWKEFKEIVEYEPLYILGDANADEIVDKNDIKTIVDYLMSGKKEDINLKNADANCDQEVNVADIVEIINMIKK